MGKGDCVAVIAVSARDVPHAGGAAAALIKDRPDLRVSFSPTGVVVSGRHAERTLHLWWTTALLNERLVADASERRRSILRELVA